MRNSFLLILFLVILLLPINTLFSKSETWLGINVDGSRDIISRELNTYIKNSGTKLFKEGNLSFFNTIGPTIELSFFPSSNFRMGLYGALQFDFLTGIDGSTNSNYFKDIKNGVKAGLALDLPFGDSMGIFVDTAFQFSWYSLQTKVIKNSKEESDYIIYSEPGVFIDLGALAKYRNLYFKCGFNFNKAIITKNSTGLNIALFVGGGFII